MRRQGWGGLLGPGRQAQPCHLEPLLRGDEEEVEDDGPARHALMYRDANSRGMTVSRMRVRRVSMEAEGFVMMKSTSPEEAAPRR